MSYLAPEVFRKGCNHLPSREIEQLKGRAGMIYTRTGPEEWTYKRSEPRSFGWLLDNWGPLVEHPSALSYQEAIYVSRP